MMTHPVRNGYSLAQIVLHWAVVVLVIAQYLGHDAMEDAWDTIRDGGTPSAETLFGANMHAAIGATILVLALIRLYLRFTRGAPPVPKENPAPLRFVAKATHVLLYALIIGLPLGGAAAWFFGVAPAAGVHSLGTKVLFFVAILHVLGALYEHFVAHTDVLKRMLRPEG